MGFKYSVLARNFDFHRGIHNDMHPYPRGGGVLDLNLQEDVPTKKIFQPAPEFLPSNDTLF